MTHAFRCWLGKRAKSGIARVGRSVPGPPAGAIKGRAVRPGPPACAIKGRAVRPGPPEGAIKGRAVRPGPPEGAAINTEGLIIQHRAHMLY
jgi:hypothetical protein